MAPPGSRSWSRDDELRRRLYRADATAADLRRYLAGRADPAEPPPPPSAPRSPRVGIAAGVVLLLAAAVMVAPHLTPPGTPRPSTPPTRVMNVGDGQTLTIEGAAPTTVATTIRDAEVQGRRAEGSGNAIVAVEAPAGAQQGGRTSITLTTSGWAPAAWRALLDVTRPDRSTFPVVLARGASDPPGSDPSAVVFVYPGGPPTRIAVAAPTGARWRVDVTIAGGL